MKRATRVVVLIVLSAMLLTACQKRLATSNRAGEPDAGLKTRTKISKETLKARLAGNKVKFIENEGDDPVETTGPEVAAVKELHPLTLKIVSVENEPTVEYHGRVYKLHEFATLNKDYYRLDSFSIPATESDIAFYNSKGITVEDFELVIRSLDESVKMFTVDFLHQLSTTEEPPRLNASRTNLKPDVSIKSELSKDDGPPPLPPPSSPTPQQDRAPVHMGEMTSRVIKRVEPAYSGAARSVGASGPVIVQIFVDEDGKVTSASALSGHPLLMAAAVEAVKQWQFKPTEMSGQRVKVRGVVRVYFKP